MASVAEVLEKAADLIEPEGAWTQGAFSRNADGSVDVRGDEDPDGAARNPVCWCVLGAIAAAAGADLIDDGFPKYGLAADAARIIKDSIWAPEDWNDDPSRKQAEVVSKLREAAALARSRGL